MARSFGQSNVRDRVRQGRPLHGFSIIEAMLAIAVFGVMAAGLLVMVVGPIQSSGGAADRERAVFLAEEGIEAVRAIRNDGWVGLVNGPHGLVKTSAWAFSGTSDSTVDGPLTYVRTVTLADVNRNLSGDIVTTGGTPDPRTKKVTSTVSWTSRLGFPLSLSVSAYLTHGNAYDWKQTTDAHFNQGTFSGTTVMNTGDAASVQLNPTGVKTWTLGSGGLITHTTDGDFGPGAFTNTAVNGTGTAADVRGTGAPKWLLIQAGSSVFETDHVDFGDGMFSNTAVADTGDLAGVQLTTTLGWAKLSTSPTAQHMNSVHCATPTLCFGVGAGGTIIKWDGTSWTTFASPTASALNDVRMVSTTFGVAVGAGGTIIHWNGTAWSTVTSPVSNALQGVDCNSAVDCWAVGASGKILRWAGASWVQFVDTGNDGWMSVDMTAATDGWVVGGSVTRRFNGATWSVVADGTNASYNDVSCTSTSNCFAVGSGGTIIRWNGTAWSTPASPTGSILNSVSMISTTDGWTTGVGGTLARWNGTAWSSVSSPSATAMNEVAMVSASEGWAVGQGGEIWNFSSHFVTSGTYTSSVIDGGAIVTWAHAFWSERLPDLTDLTIAFRTGNVAVPDGSWTAWSAEFTNPSNTSIPGAIAVRRYIQYRVTLTTTDQLVTSRLDAINLTFNEPSSSSFFDVKVTTTTDGWAVGQGGVLSRFDGVNWSSYTPSPTTSSLFDVDYFDQNNVWAVGDNGVIIKWNGTSWVTQASGTANSLYGLDVLSTTDAITVGQRGTIIRWNGTSWSAMTSPTNKSLNAVSCVSGTECWAVGDNGVVIRWDGTSWSIVASGTTNPLNGVYALSSTFAVAVGQGGLTLHWNGTSWTNVASTTPNELNDVWCNATNDCWAFGVEATFLQWNGSTWSQYVFANPSNPLILGGHMTSPTEGWAVGEGGAFYHYTPEFTSPSFYVSPVIDGGAVGLVWNTVSWDSLEPINTGITIATRTGPTPAVDGTWSSFSSEYSDKGGSNVTNPANRFIQYRVTFTTTAPQSTAVFQELRLVHSAATGQDLFDTEGTAPGDVWAVGRSGTIVHYDGSAWSTTLSPGAGNLRGVAAVTTTDAHTVGDGGNIFRWNGLLWTSQMSPTANDLLAVSMGNASLGFAVGASGVIARWNGTSWVSETSPTGNTLRGIDMLDATLGFAVGDGGTIIKWNGTTWSTVSSPTAAKLNAVHLVSTTFGWAVGDGGVIIKWNGTTWAAQSSPVASNINAVESRSATEGWAAGDFGLILYWDGASWTSFTSPTTRNLYGITVEAPTDGWICGRTGTLIKDPSPFPPSGTFTSQVLDTDAGSSVWDVMYFSATLQPSTGVTIAMRSGNVAVPDGTWSGWSSETSMTGGAVPVPSARYFQYRATLTTGNTAVTPDFEDITVTYRK